jgi:ribosomal protein S16
MAKSNYTHKVIRLRKGKPNYDQVYWIIVILNKKKTKSLKVIERLGFLKFGYQRKFVLDFQRLAFHLNNGCILKNSVKKLIYLMTVCA